MNPPLRFSKSSVMLAMTFIRPMFEQCDCDVNAYTDDELAEALLRTHPRPATQWLSREHVACACVHLAAPSGAQTPSPKSGKGTRYDGC